MVVCVRVARAWSGLGSLSLPLCADRRGRAMRAVERPLPTNIPLLTHPHGHWLTQKGRVLASVRHGRYCLARLRPPHRPITPECNTTKAGDRSSRYISTKQINGKFWSTCQPRCIGRAIAGLGDSQANPGSELIGIDNSRFAGKDPPLQPSCAVATPQPRRPHGHRMSPTAPSNDPVSATAWKNPS